MKSYWTTLVGWFMSGESYEITLDDIQNSHHLRTGLSRFRSWWKVKWAWHIASLILSQQLSWMEGTGEWWVYTSEKSKMDTKNDSLELELPFNYGDFGVHVSWLAWAWVICGSCHWWVLMVAYLSWILVTESYFGNSGWGMACCGSSLNFSEGLSQSAEKLNAFVGGSWESLHWS